MARKAKTPDAPAQPTFSDADRGRARQWFKKAEDTRERREYDYAIECYTTGLAYWPEAVEDGHMPLRSLAIQRQQAGGKKPGLMDGMKKSMSGKDPLKAMLNAEHLLSMDPANIGYAEGLLKNAAKGGFLETAKWVAPILLDLLRKEKKPSKAKFRGFRDLMVEAAHQADVLENNPLETWFLEQAVQSIEYYLVRNPGDEDLKNEQRDLAGRLTIARGKYEDAGDFRDSLQDADKQKLLHDAERLRQGDDTLEALLKAAREAWEADPTTPAVVNAYVDALLKTEQKKYEDEAIRVLEITHEKTGAYSFKLKADDVRLRQLQREVRRQMAKAKQSGDEGDRQQARLAAMEFRQTTVEIFRERVAQYPTDPRLKYRFGRALFEGGEYDEAIPVLQAAAADPRSYNECQLMIGRAFYENGSPAEAAEVLREALDAYEMTDDHSKELLYWLARSYQDAGKEEEARTAFGKLLRQDYNYRDGDARQRLDALKGK
jgi:tetratricopeptide (TPR) repeat protein